MRETDAVARSDDLTTILFDFHATLAWSRDREAWIRAAHEHAGRALARDTDTADGSPHRLQEALSQVWLLARRRDPSRSWDLSASDHRKAFTTVLTRDLGCAEWLATSLYDVMPDQWQLYDDVIDVLTSLRQVGKRVGIVSNIGIDIRRVSTRWASSALQFRRPLRRGRSDQANPAIFTRALRDLHSCPSRTLMVGDTWDQDGAAAAVGMSTLILPGKDQSSKGLRTVLDICRV